MKHCFSFPLSISIISITRHLTAAALTRQHDNDGQQRPHNNMRGSRVRRLQDCYQMCTMLWDPVCGSDGTTYSNTCMLNNAKCDNQNLIQLQVTSGDCITTAAEACRAAFEYCTQEMDPVCGSDGTTYDNACKLNRAACDNQHLRQANQGVCGAADESCTDDTKTFRDKQKNLTCQFVNTTTTRKEYWCQRPKPKRICPDTCNTCGSADRSAVRCTDDATATFRIRSSRTAITCADLAGYAQRKTDYWCGRSDVAPMSCRATCNTC